MRTGLPKMCGMRAKTIHEVRFMSELNFVRKLLVCTMCGETVRQPMIGSAGVVE